MMGQGDIKLSLSAINTESNNHKYFHKYTNTTPTSCIFLTNLQSTQHHRYEYPLNHPWVLLPRHSVQV